MKKRRNNAKTKPIKKKIHMEVDVSEEYIPVAFQLPELTNDIFKFKIDPQYSNQIEYPHFSLGFHHYIHQSKDKMEITEQFKNRKKVYHIIHQFERYIDDYDEDIGGFSKSYFNIKKQPNISSRAFYKLWELLFMFDLIPTNKSGFVSAHLAEGPGSFIQATMFYRDMFGKKGVSKKDKYYAVTLYPENVKEYVPPINKKLIDYYKKEKPKRFQLHRTYSYKMSRDHDDKDNGDLTNPKTIKLFGGNFNKKNADFITADGGFNWKNENTQEQEAFKLIFAQIITALKIQATGGNFVCKFYESFTESNVKLMCILSSFYNKVYVIKPLMSRRSNSEKYVVCINYKGVNNKKIKILEDVLKSAFKKKGKNIVNIFPDYYIPRNYFYTVTKLNTVIANRQFISINQIVDFINKQNYRGSLYHKQRDLQIKAAEYWIDLFFPTIKDYVDKKKDVMDTAKQLIENNRISSNKLTKIMEN